MLSTRAIRNCCRRLLSGPTMGWLSAMNESMMSKRIVCLMTIGSVLAIFMLVNVYGQSKTHTKTVNKKLEINNIRDSSVLEDCGCYFGSPGEQMKRRPKWI